MSTETSWLLPETESEHDLLARWPHLARPGPQPHNQIPPTSSDALAALRRPPTPKPYAGAIVKRLAETICLNQEIFIPLLLELFAPDLGRLVAHLIVEAERRKVNCEP